MTASARTQAMPSQTLAAYDHHAYARAGRQLSDVPIRHQPARVLDPSSSSRGRCRPCGRGENPRRSAATANDSDRSSPSNAQGGSSRHCLERPVRLRAARGRSHPANPRQRPTQPPPLSEESRSLRRPVRHPDRTGRGNTSRCWRPTSSSGRSSRDAAPQKGQTTQRANHRPLEVGVLCRRSCLSPD